MVDGPLGEVSCDVIDITKLIASLTPTGTSSNYCQETYYNALVAYFDEMAKPYSWTNCQYTTLDFTNAECTAGYSYYFSACQTPYPI